MSNQQKKEIPTWAWYRKKITSFFKYKVEDDKIILGKQKYTFTQLSILGYIIRFLSFMLFSMGLYAYIIGKKTFNLVSCVIAIIFFIFGILYKMIVTQSKIDKQNNKLEGDKNAC